MDVETFLRFVAFLLFAWFNLYWGQRFNYPKYRWIPFVLVCLGVLGAVVTFFNV